jgi:nucleotide-binding universal stress UspA family protein
MHNPFGVHWQPRYFLDLNLPVDYLNSCIIHALAAVAKGVFRTMIILVGYDGSELSQRALTVAQKRAKALKARLYIFTSADNGNIDGPKNNRLQTGLKDAEMMCQACGLDCRIELSNQKMAVGEDLIRYAIENKVDEIVIGLPKRSQLGKLLFGSNVRHILMEAPCPVLTVT